jgi:hypothetical protein
MPTKKALIVTTAHKGVFFGYGEPSDNPTITLENARMCVYWPQETHGVLGLASLGPIKGSRISPAAPSVILRDVTAVMEVSPAAQVNWEKGIWQ